MAALHIEGYVIVSADGMLANAAHVMPDELKFEGDKRFFTDALDRADLIVHGRHSFEDQPQLAAATTDRADAENCIHGARSIQSQGRRSGIRRARRSRRRANGPASQAARSRSSAGRSYSQCFSIATRRSGSRRRRWCGSPMAKAVFLACPSNRRRRSWRPMA